MDEVYYDGVNGLSYIQVNDMLHDTDEGWDKWREFADSYFSLYQYKDDAVLNQWGCETTEFQHDEEMQKEYNNLWK